MNFVFLYFYFNIKTFRIKLNPLEKLFQIDWLMWSNINSPTKLIYYLRATFYLIEATFIICVSIVFFLLLFWFFTEATKSPEPLFFIFLDFISVQMHHNRERFLYFLFLNSGLNFYFITTVQKPVSINLFVIILTVFVCWLNEKSLLSDFYLLGLKVAGEKKITIFY